MSMFEVIMIVCFGMAWPLSIYKSYKSKSIEGKSIFFLYVIFFGYISGITHKMINSKDIVIIFYIINLIMVFVDIMLYYSNKRRAKVEA